MSGRKRIFAIVLKEENPDIEERIKEKYPDLGHYKYTSTFFLVSDYNMVETIAKSIGIKGNNRIKDASGAVFGLSTSYSGYTDRTLWEWLDLVDERQIQ